MDFAHKNLLDKIQSLTADCLVECNEAFDTENKLKANELY